MSSPTLLIRVIAPQEHPPRTPWSFSTFMAPRILSCPAVTWSLWFKHSDSTTTKHRQWPYRDACMKKEALKFGSKIKYRNHCQKTLKIFGMSQAPDPAPRNLASHPLLATIPEASALKTCTPSSTPQWVHCFPASATPTAVFFLLLFFANTFKKVFGR